MKSYFEEKRGIMLVSSIAILILAIFLIVQIVIGIKSAHLLGESTNNVITVTGQGEVNATPDTATFTFSVIKNGATTAAAQSAADPIVQKALAYLKDQGVADADIQTQGYDINPQYTYNQPAVVCNSFGCPTSSPTISGYEVNQTVTVKVRDLSKVGTILGGLTSAGVSSESNISFIIDKEDDLKNQARSQAIQKAQDQAKELAKELGVRLGDITNFSEQGSGYAPVMFKDASVGAMVASAPTPSVPAGQNTITSNVTITYEIR